MDRNRDRGPEPLSTGNGPAEAMAGVCDASRLGEFSIPEDEAEILPCLSKICAAASTGVT